MDKRRKEGIIITFIGAITSFIFLSNFIPLYLIANSKFPPIEEAWQNALFWTIPSGVSIAVLIWGLITTLSTNKYWDWLLRDNDNV